MFRLFADENFPQRTVEELRNLNHDVLTLKDLGKASQGVNDVAVLDLAMQDNRAVLTFDRRGFRRLHKSRPQHSGIIGCTYDPDHLALAHRINSAVKPHTDLRGLLVLVYRPHR